MSISISILYSLCIIIITFLNMEIISWALHKYLFHGPLWFIHRTHHIQTLHSTIEFNDIFSLIFALIAITFIRIGWLTPSLLYFSIGFGITLYGFIYFIIHDGLIHQRYSSWNNKNLNRYLKQILRAHQRHHTYSKKSPSEEFGLFFLINKKYWQNMFIN